MALIATGSGSCLAPFLGFLTCRVVARYAEHWLGDAGASLRRVRSGTRGRDYETLLAKSESVKAAAQPHGAP